MAALLQLDNRLIFIPTTEPVSDDFRSRVTDYHVETGSNVSVNIINDPELITLTGYVSEVLYDQPVNADFGIDSQLPEEVKSLMLDFRSKRKIFKAIVNDRTIDNAVFEGINFINNVSIGNSLMVRATIKEIRVVSQNPSERIPKNMNNKNDADNNTKNKNRGAKTPQPADDASEFQKLIDDIFK